MKKLDPKKEEEIRKRLRSIFLAVDIGIKIFNQELKKAKLPKDTKIMLRCFFYNGLFSALETQISLIIMEAKQNE